MSPFLPADQPGPGGLKGRGTLGEPGRCKLLGSRRLPRPARAIAPREDTTGSNATQERDSKGATRSADIAGKMEISRLQLERVAF